MKFYDVQFLDYKGDKVMSQTYDCKTYRLDDIKDSMRKVFKENPRTVSAYAVRVTKIPLIKRPLGIVNLNYSFYMNKAGLVF